VIVVGGTGLYLRALLHGLFDVPSEESIRLALLQRVEAGELAQMHEELRVVDPEAAAWIAPRDKVRIVRALEVYQLTGRPFSSWAQAHGHREERYQAHLIGIDWPREELYRRIDQRVLSMLREGWVVEVEALLQAGYAPTLKPLQCIGYREICEMLAGRLAPESLLSMIQQATRQYARRQMTWFRKEPVTWYPTPDALFSDDTLLESLQRLGWFDRMLGAGEACMA
jgi:tRNA dimethylallyltransferase